MAAAASVGTDQRGTQASVSHVLSIDPKRMAEQEGNIKSCSQCFLGYWVDRTAGAGPSGLSLRGRACPIEEKDINVSDMRSHFAKDVGTSEEEVSSKLDRQFQASLGFTPASSVKASVSHESSRTTKHIDSKLIYAVRFVATAECRWNQPHHPISEAHLVQEGDSITQSGQVYSGYELLVIISFQESAEITTSRTEGNVNLNLFNGWLSAGASGARTMEQFVGKKLKEIRLEARGMGGYQFSIRHQSTYSFEEITHVIDAVGTSFLESLPAIRNRAYYIRAADIFESRVLLPAPIRLPLPIPAAAEIRTPVAVEPVTLENDRTLFARLAERIYSDPIRKSTLETALKTDGSKQISLDILFTNLEKFFQNVLTIMPDRRSRRSYTEVVGSTGGGKSLLIGYLLGLSVQEKQIELTPDHSDLLRDFSEVGLKGYPFVGHGGSETKGAALYQRYIDTGGYADSAGPEANICNSLATAIITRKLSPNRLIVVISSSDFENRAQPFLQILEKASKYVPAISMAEEKEQSCWSSILFVINDRESVPTEARIVQKIDRAIYQLGLEQNKLLSSSENNLIKAFFKKAYQTVKHPLETAASLAGMDVSPEVKNLQRDRPDIYQRWMEFQEQIDVLTLLKEKHNFVVVDFDHTATRDKINRWQEDSATGKLSFQDLSLIDANALDKMRAVMRATASYFTERLDENRKLLEKITRQTDEIRQLSDSLNSLSGAIAQIKYNPQDLRIAYERQKADSGISLEEAQVQLATLKEQKTKKMDEIRQLERSASPRYLRDLQSENPITPRSWWAWPGFGFAKTYPFKYTGLPIHSVTKHVPTKDVKDHPGVYLHEDLTERGYVASYRPAWRGHIEDSQAHVEIYVKEKDHPNTELRIGGLRREIEDPETGLNTQITGLESKIAGHLKWIANLETGIRGAVDLAEQKQQYERMIHENQGRLQTLQRTQEGETRSKIDIQGELDSLKKLRKLMRSLIQELGFLNEESKTAKPEKEVFTKFFISEP